MSVTIKSNHWVEEAEDASTTKKGGTIKPKIIVMHYTAGFTYKGDVYTLSKSDRKVSAHFVLGRKPGQFAQCVALNKRAWHAGPSFHKPSGLSSVNFHSIGIEICNHGYMEKLGEDKWRTWNGKEYSSPPGELAPFNEWTKAEEPILGATKSKRAYWEPYTDYQLSLLDDLVAALVKKYPTIKYVATHQEIDTRGWKTDVHTSNFPMERYKKIIESRGETTKEEVELGKMGEPDLSKAEEYFTTALIHLRQQPRWFGECNIVKTVEPEASLWVFPENVYGEFVQCLYLDKDGTLMVGWAPSAYIEEV